jgi:anthranilate phosphoribosyltransferase
MIFAEYVAKPVSTITRAASRQLMDRVLTDASVSDDEISVLLTALAARAVTAVELAGFADAMRALSTPLPFSDLERDTLVDTCGTGGDNSGTFNISSGAALVAAAAGVKIAKHGNRNITSRCGSADVLEALGIPVALSPEQCVACLRATGFTFLYAPALHPALKRVMPIRRALGFRTIFNVLGPLTNPAHAAAQVMGVYARELVPIVGAAMALLNVRRAMVVHGADGVDELTLHGVSETCEVSAETVSQGHISAADAALRAAPLSALAGGDVTDNTSILRSIFSGEKGPRRDVVVLNAAAALLVAGLASNLREGVEKSAHAIDSGALTKILNDLNEFRDSITYQPSS